MTINTTNPQPKPRRLTACHRHPNLPVTSLCPHCLHERLSLLNPSTSTTTSSSSSSSNNTTTTAAPAGPSSSSSASASSSTTLPELRRCKTFSGKNCESVGLSFEPRRRSCEDRRSGNTLEALFTADDGDPDEEYPVETKNLGAFKGTYPVHVLREVDEEYDEGDSSSDEIRVSAVNVRDPIDNEVNSEDDEDSKTMKEYIDLELEKNRKPVRKDLKEIAGSFWIAASVFSKKFQKWKKKQKSSTSTAAMLTDGRGREFGGGFEPGRRSLGEMRIENVRGKRLLRETQSEVGEYGLGRRSCDTDPRVSVDLGRESVDGGRNSVDGIGRRFCDPDPRCLLDLGRASIDCGRISVDEDRIGGFDAPRASWDGYLIGGKSMGRRGTTSTSVASATPMVSVIENAMATVYGFDNPALTLEKSSKLAENDCGRRRSFAGAYGYLDSVSLRLGKKGGGGSLFDGSDSKRSTNMNMVVAKAQEDGDSKLLASQIKKPAAPSSQIEIFHGTKLVITEKELMGSRMNSHRDDSSDSFDTSSKEMNSNSSASSSSTGNGYKKPGKWNKLLKAFGLTTRQKHGHDREEENTNGRNVDRNSGNTKDGNVAVELDSSWKLVRSSSVVSSRRSLFRRHEDAILDRNRSATNHLDNTGLLRFYLTPSRGSRRSKFGKSKLSRSDSLARSVLKL